MNEALADLKRACADSSALTESDRIRIGDSIWLTGRPAAAPEGTVALSQGPDIKVFIGEADVRGVRKEQDRYLVEVGSDTEVLVRIDKLVKPREARSCRCPKGSEGGVAQRDAGADGGTGGGSEIECVVVFRCEVIAGVRVCFLESIDCPKAEASRS